MALYMQGQPTKKKTTTTSTGQSNLSYYMQPKYQPNLSYYNQSSTLYQKIPTLPVTTTPKVTTVTAPAVTSTQNVAPSQVFSSGGGYNYSLPQYNLPEVNISVPNLNWQPSAEQLAEFLSRGQTRAATVIDPQVQAVQQALARFKTEAENERAEINPRYTNMSLALANVIKNQVLQLGIENLIRRGAVESGNLDELYRNAGRFETEQRAGVEQERNQILNALAKQIMAKEQETSDALTELEKLRGQYSDVYSQEAEKEAWNRFLTEKQSTFENELAKAQLQNAIAAAIAEQQYRSALLNQQARQSEFENALAEKKFGLEQLLANYQMRPQTTFQKPETMVTVDTPYGKIPLTVQQAIQAGFLAPAKQKSLADYLFGS